MYSFDASSMIHAWDNYPISNPHFNSPNLEKHRLDFIDADYVIESPYRLDIETIRNGEYRQQSFAYVFERLMVLTVVYIPNEKPHIISFRPAKNSEREVYYDWLENDYNDN